MNLKTTLVLIVLLAAGVGATLWLTLRQTEEKSSPTISFLNESLDAKKITRIEVKRGRERRFVLERTGDEWALEGKWPVREVELRQWLDAFNSLRSRFAPLPLKKDKDKDKLAEYGLDVKTDPLTITLTLPNKIHILTLGEEATQTNQWSRPTFLRLDDLPEVVRLGPGTLAQLDRAQDHFLQRRLFPFERVARDDSPRDKVEQLKAKEVEVETRTAKFTLVHHDQTWILKDVQTKKDKGWQKLCSEDRVDPERLKTLLMSFPDLWAEKFIDTRHKNLAKFGLDQPQYVLTVNKKQVAIGDVASTKPRLVEQPPIPSQFGPKKLPPKTVFDEYRYAKRENNDLIFEVKGEKLKDIALDPDALRDPVLARFKPDDVKRLEIQHGEDHLVLVKEKVKDKERWRFEQPVKLDAETKPVEEILDKLAGLQARDKDILDNVDLKSVGLEKPQGRIKISLEEKEEPKNTEESKEKKEKQEPKIKKREIVFALGTKENDKEKDKGKLYVRVDAWPRVNQVEGDLWKLAQRPVLAYRQRRVLDLAAADIDKIEIERPGETFAFAKTDAGWKLAVPVSAEVEAKKVTALADDIAKLEGLEFVSEAPKKEELDKVFGLAKPSLVVKLHPKKDAKKGNVTLAIGKQRAGKQEYFARVGDGPIFAVKKNLLDDLSRSSLSYRSPQLLQLSPDAIQDIQVSKDGAEFRLKKDGKKWKIAGAFEAEASESEADEMAETLARLKCERFEEHQVKDAKRFGFDKPTLKIQFAEAKGKPRTLEIGKNADKLGDQWYARLSDQPAAFVLSSATIKNLNRGALELLDPLLLSLSLNNLEQFRVQGTSSFILEPVKAKEKEKTKRQWQVVNSPAPTFIAMDETVMETLLPLQHLRAEKYAAYGNKIDWKQYGLDKPAVILSAIAKADGDKAKKSATHVLELGKEAPGGGRFARLDKKDAVVVLGAKTATALNRTHLDFVDPLVLQYDADTLNGIQRQKAGGDLELIRQEDQWRLLKPVSRDADNLTLNDMLTKTFRLRAKRIAAYPAKDLSSYGLDKPVAVVTLQLEVAGTPKKHVIKVGSLVTKAAEERYAMIDDKPVVAVLAADLSRHLVAPVLYFADRNLATFNSSSTDFVKTQGGGRVLSFRKTDATWQMEQPVKAGAEDAALDDLLRGVQRLRADEIVADKGADLKKYGLDTPVQQWLFKSGDKEQLHLLVGAAENDKPGARRYAQVGSKGEVFLLSAKLTAKLEEEYRGRKPWPPLDVAQVDRLTVTTADKAFTLRKKDESWSVMGEPDFKVNAKKVIDTLDALAALKAQHYVADAKANLQTYGLDKPAWKINVQAPTGKRELLLGRTEGGSTRFYATVPGSDAVFVLSAADSARIARPLAAYLEGVKK